MIKSLLKLTSLFLIFFIISVLFLNNTVSAEAGIPISTKAEFYNIRNNLNGNDIINLQDVVYLDEHLSGWSRARLY